MELIKASTMLVSPSNGKGVCPSLVHQKCHTFTGEFPQFPHLRQENSTTHARGLLSLFTERQLEIHNNYLGNELKTTLA